MNFCTRCHRSFDFCQCGPRFPSFTTEQAREPQPLKVDESCRDSLTAEFTLQRIFDHRGLAMNRPHVLSGVCRTLGLSLTTEWWTKSVDKWKVSSHLHFCLVEGTIHEVVLYLRGYIDAVARAERENTARQDKLREAVTNLQIDWSDRYR